VTLDILDPVSIKEAVAETSKLLPNGLDNFVSNAGADLQTLVPFEKLCVLGLNPVFKRHC